MPYSQIPRPFDPYIRSIRVAYLAFESATRRIDDLRQWIPDHEKPYHKTLGELYDTADRAVVYMKRHGLVVWPKE